MADHLFTSFTTSSKQEWQQKVIADLKGKSIEDYYIEIDPQLEAIDFLAHSDDAQGSVSAIQTKSSNHWRIGEYILVNDPVKANKQALLALEQGANSIHFELDSEVDLDILCNGIMHEYIHTIFAGNGVSMDTPIHFKNFLVSKNQNPELVSCSFFADPPNLDLYNIVFDSFTLGKGYRVRAHKESVVQIISEILHQLNFLFNGLIDQEYSREHIGQRFTIEYTLKENFYLNIASIRAIHLVVHQLKEAWQIPESTIDISAVARPSKTETSNKDSEKISNTSKAMAAVIGGISELVLVPKIEQVESSEFEHRIARNIQHVMQLESFMNRVVDPSGGSYFIENLTEKIAEAAWNEFRKNWSAKK